MKYLIFLSVLITYISSIQIVEDSMNDMVNSQYSSELAHTLGGFTVASYCKQKKIENWSCGKICRQNPLTDIEVVYAEETNALAFTGYSTNLDAIVIVFRGTMPLSLENWLSDLDLVMIKYPYCNGCKIHKGFSELYNSLQEQVWDNLGALISQYPHAKIMLTGHSLGAALSTLFAADMIQHGINDYTWYNFGSPRVGNTEFQQYLQNSYSQNLFRVTHDKDPFVHLPEMDLGYHHLAQEIFYVSSPEPDAEHKFCNQSGEDPNCADQYKKLSEWVINDHNTYMGYNYIKTMTACNL